MEILEQIDAFVWGPVMIVLLLGSHIFLTFRTRFIQRKIPQAIKMSLKKTEGEGDISPFGALATALAATIGTGSIVGVATAILAGGPGAIFWMWLTGVFGIATKYSEVFVAIKYRVKDHNGNMLGGAMYAWQRGFTKNGKVPCYCGDRHGIGSTGIGDDRYHDLKRPSGRAVDHRHRDRGVGRGGHLRWREDHL